MIKTIFDEKYDAGGADTGQKAVLAVVERRFNQVPQDVKNVVRAIKDPSALVSLAAQAGGSQSLEEFANALKKINQGIPIIKCR